MTDTTSCRSRIFNWLLMALALCCLLFIFSNSLKDGEESAKQSGAVVELVKPAVEQILPLLQIEPTHDNVVRFVRKAAHFSEFALLSCLICFAVRRFTHKKALYLTIPMSCAALAAFADEGIQLFSVGRAGSLKDVLIDTSGAAAGLLFAVACLWIGKKLIQKKEENT